MSQEDGDSKIGATKGRIEKSERVYGLEETPAEQTITETGIQRLEKKCPRISRMATEKYLKDFTTEHYLQRYFRPWNGF